MTYLVVVNFWTISGIRETSSSSLQQTSSLQHRGAFVTEDEVNASLHPPAISPSPSSPQATDVRLPSASWPYKSTASRQDSHGFQAHRHRPSAGSNTTSLRQPPSSNQPPRFSVEDQAYLRGRLPLRQRVSAQTVINHFRRLPLLYQDLAEGCRAHVSRLPPGARELEKRQRMAELAQRQADRHMRFRLILPRSYIVVTLARWQGELSHTSRFWEKTLKEIEVSGASCLSLLKQTLKLCIHEAKGHSESQQFMVHSSPLDPHFYGSVFPRCRGIQHAAYTG